MCAWSLCSRLFQVDGCPSSSEGKHGRSWISWSIIFYKNDQRLWELNLWQLLARKPCHYPKGTVCATTLNLQTGSITSQYWIIKKNSSARYSCTLFGLWSTHLYVPCVTNVHTTSVTYVCTPKKWMIIVMPELEIRWNLEVEKTWQIRQY